MNGISVLMVNYNGGLFVKEAIESMCNLLICNNIKYEILLLDNNSTDDSISIIEHMDFSKYNISFFKSNDNLGFGKGNNYLANKAKHNVLMLLNNDTKTVDLRNIIDFIKKNRLTNEIITSKIYNNDMSIQNNLFRYPSTTKLFLDLFLLKPLVKYLLSFVSSKDKILSSCSVTFSGCFLLLSNELYSMISGFDEEYTFYHEEGDFFYRLERIVKVNKLIYDDIIIHYGGGGKEISNFAFTNYYLGLYKLFVKNNFMNKKYLYFLFNLSFKLRIGLLKLGVKINYSPFSTIYKVENTKSKIEIISMHQSALNEIRIWNKGK